MPRTPRHKGFKPLIYERIIHVYSMNRRERCLTERLMPAHPSIMRDYDTIPRGMYVAVENGIVLPKRRRGEQFRVIYTEAKEKVF